MFDSKSNKKGLKRIRKPVMYDIEPMPDKIEATFDSGDQQDQALIGNPYCLKVNLIKKEQVRLRSLRLVVVDVISAVSTIPGSPN